ncbi:hypothetical protein JK358_12415 [Nocardia sp. 2]|uniref:Uncharacterized protein n=1 Tax=Nocardia acididurans TaxID=2802282 RepID=A0ABS1M3U2_9NOCA|nr:hypothetical protein [Nocardia acididurans]MBL1075196.1 hypothetical protein [Nocardia acididurans]
MGENGAGQGRDRRALLDEGNRLREKYRGDGYTAAGKEALYQLYELQDAYRAQLPEVSVSRCPFTGVEVRWPLDDVDLDGWFWDWDKPARRLVNPVPRTWLAMGGAVRLAEPVTAAPFMCKPGPDAPYVIPQLLEVPEVRAVVAEVPIGRHTGWATTYFATIRPTDIPLENTWGSQKYDVYDTGGQWRAWSEHRRLLREYDFELRPWLESGKLLWIAPGDSGVTLREGVAECPYLDIDGERRRQRIHNGEINRF